jgi:tRNA-specific 2-thiouridylase
VSGLNWISITSPTGRIRCRAKIRSRHREADAWVELQDEGRVRIDFDLPQSAITPGQAAVFYDGDVVLGGGWITRDSG